MDSIIDMNKFLSLNSPQYIVRGNDTLEKISDKTGMAVHALRKINKIFGDSTIHEGQVLNLQVPYAISPSPPSSSSTSTPIVSDAVHDSLVNPVRSVFNIPLENDIIKEDANILGDDLITSAIARRCQSDDNLVARVNSFGIGNGCSSSSSGNGSHSEKSKDPLIAAYESNYELSEVYIDNNFSSRILNSKKLTLLNAYLPVLHQCESWTLLYSLYEHGADFGTFYNRVEGYQKTIIVVQADTNEIFGGYATGEWKVNPLTFGGTGQSFLFKFIDDAMQHFGWTELNEFFMRCAEDQIAMGGGGDGFGFVLDRDFITGGSSRCDTFNNEPLTKSTSGTFKIINVEIYGFGSSLKKGYKRN